MPQSWFLATDTRIELLIHAYGTNNSISFSWSKSKKCIRFHQLPRFPFTGTIATNGKPLDRLQFSKSGYRQISFELWRKFILYEEKTKIIVKQLWKKDNKKETKLWQKDRSERYFRIRILETCKYPKKTSRFGFQR